MKAVNAKSETVYVLAPSQIQMQLRKLITRVLQPLSLYPLPAVATSYSTLSYGDYPTDALVANEANLILQHQFSHEINKILDRYRDSQQRQLKKLFGKVALKGLILYLHDRHPIVRRPIEGQLKAHPEKTPQVIHYNLDLLLEYGLRKFAPSFTQKKSHLRLLILELKKILPPECFPSTPAIMERAESTKFSRMDKKLLASFLDQISQIKFMLIVPFGFPELQETRLEHAAERFESFVLWKQKLKDGTLDIEHATFLFDQGAHNIKRFIAALRDPDFRKLKLKRLLAPSPTSPMEVDLHLKVDLREAWDLLFLYKGHRQGKQPEFYSEILSLVRARRNDALKKGLLKIPDKRIVRKILLTSKGFLVYYKGQKQPEITGPNRRAY